MIKKRNRTKEDKATEEENPAWAKRRKTTCRRK